MRITVLATNEQLVGCCRSRNHDLVSARGKVSTPLLIGWIRDQAEHYGKLVSNYRAIGTSRPAAARPRRSKRSLRDLATDAPTQARTWPLLSSPGADVRQSIARLEMQAAPFLLLLISLAQASANDWTAAGTKGDVTLAFRDDRQLEVREVRATTELPFPAARIFPLVCDFSNYKSLVSGVEETRTLAGSAPSDYEIYMHYAPRFVVVAARDVVVHVQSQSTVDGSSSCRWTELKDRELERKGIVRMKLLRGSWTIEPLDEGRSRVVYQVAVNPGGRLPGWLVRRGAVSALPAVIEQVRRRLERDSQASSR